MASVAALTQQNDALFAAFNPHQCAHCRTPIGLGERWVREKIYEPSAADGPRYQRYHADLSAGDELSCWEKHQLQRETVPVVECDA
jgi:hypothetical protein